MLNCVNLAVWIIFVMFLGVIDTLLCEFVKSEFWYFVVVAIVMFLGVIHFTSPCAIVVWGSKVFTVLVFLSIWFDVSCLCGDWRVVRFLQFW